MGLRFPGVIACSLGPCFLHKLSHTRASEEGNELLSPRSEVETGCGVQGL